MRESDVQDEIRLKLAESCKLFRNNTGRAWTGDISRLANGAILIINPRPLQCGLIRGGSDLIGWHSLIITGEMVGMKLAVFTAVECKSERGRLSADQVNFIAHVNQAGGIGIVARSAEEAAGGIKSWSTRRP